MDELTGAIEEAAERIEEVMLRVALDIARTRRKVLMAEGPESPKLATLDKRDEWHHVAQDRIQDGITALTRAATLRGGDHAKPR